MKLRVRVQQQDSRLELPGEEPSLTELVDLIKVSVLSSRGLSADTEFSLSLNGSELLTDTGQTLASCGIVSGDLICVVLHECAAASGNTPPSSADTQQTVTMASNHGTPVMKDAESSHLKIMKSDLPEALSGGPSGGPAAEREEDRGPPLFSWEPMLCGEAEEGQAPLSLELLYHSAQTTSPSDALMVAANLLMVETGFVPEGCELKPAEMPPGWRSAGGAYKLQYSHPLCGSSLAMLVAVSMGPTLVINAVLKVDQAADTVRKLSVNPASYVTHEWPGESAAAAFRDLKKLSRVFKDQLAYPVLAAAREALALPVAFGLAALPPELLLRILRLLDVVSVVRLSAVCRHFHGATDDSTLWRHLFRRDFTDSDPSRPRDTDWKELYKQQHKHCRDLRRSHPHILPPFRQSHREIFNPLPPYPLPPGIIGGEYDQRPNLPYGLLPRPRYDPIGPFQDLNRRPPTEFHSARRTRGRPVDVRRGFI